MATPAATVVTMTTTTACCNGHPSPLLQDNTSTPTSATERYAPYFQTRANGFQHNPTDYNCIVSRDMCNTRRRKTVRLRWILTLSVACVLVIITSVVLSCLVMRYLLIVREGSVDGQKSAKMCVVCGPTKHQPMPSYTEGAVCCASDEAKMEQLIVEVSCINPARNFQKKLATSVFLNQRHFYPLGYLKDVMRGTQIEACYATKLPCSLYE